MAQIETLLRFGLRRAGLSDFLSSRFVTMVPVSVAFGYSVSWITAVRNALLRLHRPYEVPGMHGVGFDETSCPSRWSYVLGLLLRYAQI